MLTSAAFVVDEVVQDGYWDSRISGPTLQLLDEVVGGYGHSADGVVGSEEIGGDAARK